MLDEDAFAADDAGARRQGAGAPARRRRCVAAPPPAAGRRATPTSTRVQSISGITADTLAGLPEMDRGEEVVEFEASDAGDWSDAPVAASRRARGPRSRPMPLRPTAAASSTPCSPACAARRCRTPRRCRPGDHAARNFRVGQTYAAAAMLKEAADAFEKAARDPRYRFRSAQSLGRLYRKHGMLNEAVEWLDIASEAPAPKIDEHRSALYELADALETTGEHTRALAVLLDLVAEQSDYRDARARIERLSRVKA